MSLGMLNPPPGNGSGKSLTPWERMQSEKAIPATPPLDGRLPALLGLLEDPQATIAAAHPSAASVSAMPRW